MERRKGEGDDKKVRRHKKLLLRTKEVRIAGGWKLAGPRCDRDGGERK